MLARAFRNFCSRREGMDALHALVRFGKEPGNLVDIGPCNRVPTGVEAVRGSAGELCNELCAIDALVPSATSASSGTMLDLATEFPCATAEAAAGVGAAVYPAAGEVCMLSGCLGDEFTSLTAAVPGCCDECGGEASPS
jgi:hypothetical protein